MAKNQQPLPSLPAVKRRGRPPRPDGPTPQAEIQRRYRARLKAAGKVLKLVDAGLAANAIPAYDPDTHFVCERALVGGLRYDLDNALSKIERLTEDLKQLQLRNGYLEGDLKRAEQHHTAALKEIIVLKKQLAETTAAGSRAKGRRKATQP